MPRPQRHLPGELHVLLVRSAELRERNDGADAPEVRIVAELNGVPGSARSRLRSAALFFITDEGAVPRPSFDARKGRAELWYPMTEMATVLDVLHAKGEQTCYLWRSANGEHAIAWLIALD